MNNNNNSITNTITTISYLPDDTLEEIFLYLGASGTARCSIVCQQWNQKITTNSDLAFLLWRHFMKEDFGIQQEEEDKINDVVKWRNAYRYIVSRSLSLKKKKSTATKADGRRRGNTTTATAIEKIEEEIERVELELPVTVLFPRNNNKLNYPGYPPENAFDPEERRAWCTNLGFNKNFDLIVELPTTCLVTGFVVENGNQYYTAPLKEALVFVSTSAPADIEDDTKTTRRIKDYYNDEEGTKWVFKLIDRVPIIQREEAITRINNYNATTTQKTKLIHTNTTRRRSNNDNNDNEPIAAFRFPSDYDACINTEFQYNLCVPIVARYIHFKLLSSVTKPSSVNNTTIDILNLAILGIDLPDLSNILLGGK